MTFYLSDEARIIIDRHESQDRERAHANKTRIAQIHEIRALENEAIRNRRYLADFRFFESKNGDAKGPKDAQAKSQIEAIDRDLTRWRKQRAALEAKKLAPILTSARIYSELDRLAAIELIPVKRPEPTLAKGERSLLEALPRLRENVSILKADRHRIAKSALPAAAAKKAAREAIARLASRGLPKVMNLFSGGDVVWPRVASLASGARYIDQTIDGAALVAFLFQDVLIEKLDELVDFNAGAFDRPLSALDRTKQITALDAQIDEAERIEAAAVESLVLDGQEVSHRPDINVLAVLSYAAK
jgi:hypothetical protein